MDTASIAAAMTMQAATAVQDLNMLMVKQALAQEQAALTLVTQANQSPPAPSAPHLGNRVDILA